MSENRQRPVIDLDELERQLRAAAGHRERAMAPPATDDPLAELARIVGQDDPHKSYWTAHGPAPRDQREPTFDTLVDDAAHPHHDDPHGSSYQPHGGDHSAAGHDHWAMRTSLHDDRHAQAAPQDGFVPQHGFSRETEPLYEDHGQLPPHDGDFEDEPRPVARKRGWLAIGAVLSVAVVGVAGAMVWRSPAGTKLASGLPPLIKADPSPAKVVPENPGGIEVPNQDRQIYAKGTPDDMKGVKLVGGEEQPLDVKQATRKDLPNIPVATAATTASTTTSPIVDPATMPRPSPGQVPGLGEARRVKTVSVRPDGTIIDPGATASTEPAPARVASLAAAVDIPAPAAGGATPSPSLLPAPRPKPLTTATTTASTTPAKPKAPDAIAIASGAVPATAATTPKPAAPKPVQVASAAADDEPAGGGFAVQLAAPVSEQEARDTTSRLEKRFAGELGGLKPAIRKADVNGKTIYRVRVSGLSRDDANALCSKLQSSGGQCFVAKN
jgi:hypothetical protein